MQQLCVGIFSIFSSLGFPLELGEIYIAHYQSHGGLSLEKGFCECLSGWQPKDKDKDKRTTETHCVQIVS